MDIGSAGGEGGVVLDETTVSVWDGRLVACCRLQGFEGRGSGARYLAWGDGRRWHGGRLWQVEDPGCNARLVRDLFVHPHSRLARRDGALVRLAPPWEERMSAEVLASFGEGGFGYSDMVALGRELLVVFERDRGLWEATLPASGVLGE